ncbi:MAG: DUF2071 domain-containing protein [Planctomycetota bacterium]|nr:DUF2071 domain-containing protein [Planctomycetota bacterium]
MFVPVISGLIDRRILVNYRFDPKVIEPLLPAPFRPLLVKGRAIAGICLIRLKQVRPRLLPAWMGLQSENAAHRIAVEWDDETGVRTGVYVPRRDSSSRLNALIGGRWFPGVQHLARFQVAETPDHLSVRLDSVDGQTHVLVEGTVATQLPETSVFSSISEASQFFRNGAVGYSATRTPGVFDGMELETDVWKVEPLAVERVESSWISNERLFPPGSVEFDSALLMRGIPHEWKSRPRITDGDCCAGNVRK